MGELIPYLSRPVVNGSGALALIAANTQRLDILNGARTAARNRNDVIRGQGLVLTATETPMIVSLAQHNPLGMRDGNALLLDACFSQPLPVVAFAAILRVAVAALAMLVYAHLAIGRIGPSTVVSLALPFAVSRVVLPIAAPLHFALTIHGIVVVTVVVIGAKLFSTGHMALPVVLNLALLAIGFVIMLTTARLAPALQPIALTTVLSKLGQGKRSIAPRTVLCGIMRVHIDLRSMCHAHGCDQQRVGFCMLSL
jgi:hypothetical protein